MGQFIQRPALRTGAAGAAIPGRFRPVLAILLAIAVVALGVSIVGGFRGAASGLSALVVAAEDSGPARLLGIASTDRQTIWARLPIQAPECNCHTPPLARVYSTLEDEHLEEGLVDQGSVGSWQYMSLTFDARQVSRQHILDLIATDGGVVLPARPANLPTPAATGHA